MPPGRPNIAERVVLDYVAAKPDRTLDRQLDAAAISAVAEQRGMPQFNLPSVIKRMHAKSLLHPLQHGRWVVSPGGVPTRTARLDELDVVADAVLRPLDIDHYLSWHSALWHYGLIDQQAPAHVRRGDQAQTASQARPGPTSGS